MKANLLTTSENKWNTLLAKIKCPARISINIDGSFSAKATIANELVMLSYQAGDRSSPSSTRGLCFSKQAMDVLGFYDQGVRRWFVFTKLYEYDPGAYQGQVDLYERYADSSVPTLLPFIVPLNVNDDFGITDGDIVSDLAGLFYLLTQKQSTQIRLEAGAIARQVLQLSMWLENRKWGKKP